MSLTNDLLYLLLLYAVLDESGKLTTTTGILIAVGIMLVDAFCGDGLKRLCGGHKECECEHRDCDDFDNEGGITIRRRRRRNARDCECVRENYCDDCYQGIVALRRGRFDDCV